MQLWVVSNCGDNGSPGAKKRMNLVRSLIDEGLSVETYGNCFKNRETYNNMPLEEKKSFKFYISFENSYHCLDYITEKFWKNSLEMGIVPIVWGPSREDMDRLAPPNSYIFYEDFQNQKDLVAHINFLSKNPVEYRKYFEWRTDSKWRNFINKQKDTYGAEILCRKIKERTLPRKSIPDMAAFWYQKEREECMNL